MCNSPLEPNEHGNRKAHKKCAYEHKKQSQKEKFKVGNSAKLKIQKNETVAANLYKLDLQKTGIPYLVALEHGLNFNCPSTRYDRLNTIVYFFDHYGYSIKTINGEHLIFIYHESDLQ
jgi:hypothetical protein